MFSLNTRKHTRDAKGGLQNGNLIVGDSGRSEVPSVVGGMAFSWSCDHQEMYIYLVKQKMQETCTKIQQLANNVLP